MEPQPTVRYVTPLYRDSKVTNLCSYPLCCMLSGEAAHTNLIVFVSPDRVMNPQSTIFQENKLTNTPQNQSFLTLLYNIHSLSFFFSQYGRHPHLVLHLWKGFLKSRNSVKMIPIEGRIEHVSVKDYSDHLSKYHKC